MLYIVSSRITKIEAKKKGSNHSAGTNQPRLEAAAIESVCRNQSSLNPQKGLKTAVTIEAVETRLK
jgi:hypothetical protein